MPASFDKESLLLELSGPDLLTITGRADLLRRERFGDRATFCMVRSLDVGWSKSFSPIAGLELAPGSRALNEVRSPGDLTTALLERAHPAAGDYHVLVAKGTDLNALLALCQAAATALDELMTGAPPGAVRPTFQLGTAADWIEGLEVAGSSAEQGLGQAREAGLRVISDGVRPRIHPCLGEDSARRWSEFWRGAGAVGVLGNATVLFGPDHGLPQVLDQIEAISALQDQIGKAEGAIAPFQSVAPVVFSSHGFGGPSDTILTQGQEDLRVLAACRLGLPRVPQLRMIYARSELKMAHLSLACGVDDLEGPLFDGERDAQSDAESADLSLDEMARWLGEAGYEPNLRNGAFEIQPPDETQTTQDETTA